MSRLLPVAHEKIHNYLLIGKSLGNEPKGALKHKVNGYQLFKKRFGKDEIRVKHNIMCVKKTYMLSNLCSLVSSFR